MVLNWCNSSLELHAPNKRNLMSRYATLCSSFPVISFRSLEMPGFIRAFLNHQSKYLGCSQGQEVCSEMCC